MAYYNWCLTVNNFRESDIDDIKKLCDEGKFKRITVGIEKGESGTPHLQIALSLKKKGRFSSIKKMFPRGHIEPMRATGDEAYEYCRKENEVIIDFNLTKPGKRTDIDKFIESVKEGKSNRDLWNEHPKAMLRYSRMVPEARRNLLPEKSVRKYSLSEFNVPPLEFSGRSIILYGEPGIGKTQFALAHFENPLVVSHLDDLKAFDGHDGIVFDDMHFGHFPRTAQIHLVDNELPRSINVKHGIATIPAGTKKIFTTNERDIFGQYMEDPAIKRRYKVHHFTHNLFN